MNEMRDALKLLNGTEQDRKLVYDWLIAKVANGEDLNFGYRKMLAALHAEFEGPIQ